MKLIKKITLVLLSIGLCIVVGHLYLLSTLNAEEEYHEDQFLTETTNKRALVVVAHDDDICAASGTLAKLTAEGWDIKQISFHDGNDQRAKRAQQAVSKIISGEITFLNENGETYRTDLSTNKRPYLALPKEQFKSIFKHEELASRLRTKIETFKPSVIFTLDHKIGGYGHPDHVFISQLVVDLCQDERLGVQKIYQTVYPPSMEQRVNVDWTNMWNKFNVYENACKVYQEPEGMPEPTCSIDIYNFSDKKMAYLKSFGKQEQKNLKKFIPGYHYYPSWLYFLIFDKEYFHVISPSKNMALQ